MSKSQTKSTMVCEQDDDGNTQQQEFCFKYYPDAVLNYAIKGRQIYTHLKKTDTLSEYVNSHNMPQNYLWKTHCAA